MPACPYRSRGEWYAGRSVHSRLRCRQSVGSDHGAVRRAARRIFGLLPQDQAAELLALWTEFEAAATPDAVFAKALDRCQPAVQNLRAGGNGWREYAVTLGDIETRVGTRIAAGAPGLWSWLHGEIKGWFG